MNTSAASASDSPLYDVPIDHARPIKVICIGAGIGGMLVGIRFPQRISNLELVIYEKNADIGGTWFENQYSHYIRMLCRV